MPGQQKIGNSHAEADNAPATGRVQAIDRAFTLLRELSSPPFRATALELSKQVGLDRTTVHRLLKTLLHWGMVQADDGVYSLGAESLLFATANASQLGIRRAALPFAVELQEKVLKGLSALVSISVPVSDKVIIVERVWTPLTPMNVIVDIGNHFPIDESASGTAILSTYPAAMAIAAIGKRRHDKVLPVLKRIREAGGLSASVSQYKQGLGALAHPFSGRDDVAVGAIVVAGIDMTDELQPDSPLGRHLQRACQSISVALKRG